MQVSLPSNRPVKNHVIMLLARLKNNEASKPEPLHCSKSPVLYSLKFCVVKVNLEQAIFEIAEDYEVKIAETVEEDCKLLEVGFEYVTDMEGKKCLGSANEF